MVDVEKFVVPACIYRRWEIEKCNKYFEKTYKKSPQILLNEISDKDKERFFNFLKSRKKHIVLFAKDEKNQVIEVKVSKLFRIDKGGFILGFEKAKGEEYRDFYKSIFEKSIDGILVEDLSRKIINVNKALSRMLGYKIDELIGRNSLEFLEKKSIEVLDEIPRGGIYELNLVKKNGGILPIEARAWVDELEGEKVAVGILRDISNYKKVIEELNDLRKKLEREVKSQGMIIKALSRLGVGIAIFQDYKGIVGAVRKANNHLLKIMGYKRKEVIDKRSFKDFLSEESFERVISNYQKRIRGEKTEHLYEMVVIDRKGRKHILLSNIEKITYKGKPATFGFYFDITEKKEKERVLYEKERQLALLANNFNGFLWQARLSSDGRFINNIITKGIYKITGYSSKELSINDENFLRIFHPDDLPLLKESVERLEKGKKVTLECRVIDKSGNIKWLHGSADASKDNEGNFIFTGFAVDITKRKEYEAELRGISLAVRASSEIFIIIDNKGKILYVNPAFEKITGFKFSEVKEEFFYKLYEILPGNENIYKEFLENRKWQGILYKKKKNGDTFKVFSSVSPIYDSKDKVIGYFIVERDLSEEDKLIEKMKKLFESLTALGFSFILLNRKGRKKGFIKFANKEFFDLTGFNEKEIIGKKEFSEIIEVDGEKTDIFDNLDENLPKKAKLKGKTQEYIIEFNMKSIEFDGEDSVFVLIRDITEKEKLEDRIRKIQKYEAMGMLAGGIAHDFNNILATIMGYLYLIKRDIKDSTLLRKLEKIEDTTQRASSLTNQLVGFARRGKYEIKPINVEEHILNVIEILNATVDRRINIIFDKIDELFVIEADPSQFEQSIMNVLLNSVEAMPKGGDIKITVDYFKAKKDFVRKYPFVSEGEYAEISIKDTGIGIDESTLGKIFEPFFTTKEKRSGLGLSNVYGIVRNHGGFLFVDSKIEEGTTIKLYFPLSEKNIFTKRVKKERRNRIKKEKKREILVIEDEDLIREMFKEMLSDKGFKVITAEDGLKGVEKFEKSSSIDLIILDMNMPRMSGKETFFKLKQIKPDVKIIVSTGYTLDNDVRTLLKNGAVGFVHKPFRGEELFSVIEKTFES